MTHQPMRSGAGRRSAEPTPYSLVRVDGEVSPSILGPIRRISAITEAELVRLG